MTTRLATCSFTEFRPEMGTAVRFTASYPRFLKLGYTIAGNAKSIAPVRDMLQLPKDAYTLTYRRQLNAVGVDGIRAELRRIAGASDSVVLLCYERLNERAKTGGENWCHRTMFAEFWLEKTGEQVPELGAAPRIHSTPASEQSLFDA